MTDPIKDALDKRIEDSIRYGGRGVYPYGYEFQKQPVSEERMIENSADAIIPDGRGWVPPCSVLRTDRLIIRNIADAMRLVCTDELYIVITADFSPELMLAINQWRNANKNLMEAIANEKTPFQRFCIRLSARLKSFGKRFKKEETRKEPRP